MGVGWGPGRWAASSLIDVPLRDRTRYRLRASAQQRFLCPSRTMRMTHVHARAVPIPHAP